ncbi:calcium-binding protein [Tritonibacter scottomollicae]|uniref:calcium-binding protein n=1 Tax=Tritonibacter scottomollicae TaxID=483013 RepID=UPI003AA7F995
MPTITFDEFELGTTDPTFVFADNTIRTNGVIVGDGAQPNTPAIAANTSYRGPVLIFFDTPATSVSLDAGYFDNLTSTRIEFRDQLGRVIETFHNDSLGVLTFSLEHDAGIASIAVIDESFDAAGFSVDTIIFEGAAVEFDAPEIDLVDTAGSVDLAFGRVERGSTLNFTDAVGTADSNDFLSLTVDAATTATVRTYLSNDPSNVRTAIIDLEVGENFLRITAGENYGESENYTVVVEVDGSEDPDQGFITETLASALGAVFDYQEFLYDTIRHVQTHVDSADDAVRFLRGMSRAYGVMGMAVDISNRIDNINAARDHGRQAVIESVDAILALFTTGGVTTGISFVGTPIAGAVAGFAASIIYTHGFSEVVRSHIGESYDDYVSGDNILVAGELVDTALTEIFAEADDFSHLIFDETYYLNTYSDAADAVASGEVVNGLAHYLAVGIYDGHSINADEATVAPEDLATNFEALDPGAVFDNRLFAHVLGTRAGDLLTQGEVALVDHLNNEQRTEGSELSLNSSLSALANRVAQDWVLNSQETIPLSIADTPEGESWAAVLSSGEHFRDALADLAETAGIDMSTVTLLASWGGGADPSEILDGLLTDLSNAQSLLGLDSQSIGIAQVGGIWIALVTTTPLQDDGVASDESVLRLLGDETGNQLLGSAGMDLIRGLDGADYIDARDGDDQIYGGDQNDQLHGGRGNDTIEGGQGDDFIVGAYNRDGIEPDLVSDFPFPDSSGVVAVGADISNTFHDPIALPEEWSLAPTTDVEQATERPHMALEISGSGDTQEAFYFDAVNGHTWIFDIDGADFDTVLELYDADGNQIAYNDDASADNGGTGSRSRRDSFLSHTFDEDGTYTIVLRSYGNDAIAADEVALLNISVDGATWELPDSDNLSGGSGNDTILGGIGNDTLDGGDGLDSLVGGDGDDIIIGGDSESDLRDMIYGGAGNDSIDGGFGNDELRGDEGNDSIEGGFGVDTVIGGAGDDVLTGSAWSDLVYGGGGSDFINGGFGSDRVNGGSGADRFFHLGIADHGSDWIQDFHNDDGDVLVFGDTGATIDQFQVNFTETANAGESGVAEAFVIYRPTGQIMWALVDGGSQDELVLRISGNDFDLLS